MIIVTGGAGFIGSNIVKALNQRGREDIIVVDDLSDGTKFTHLADLRIQDYWDKDEFLHKIKNRDSLSQELEAIFHEGACSTTTEWNGRYMMENNYAYSKEVLHYCMDRGVSFLYASSAATYGDGKVFKEALEYERPLNVYGYSKFLFDQYVRKLLPEARNQIVGCRYFNVYGPNEQHKGSMASVAYHFDQQLPQTGVLKLFEGCDGYGNGEQLRDFIFVDDVVNVNLWFLDNPHKSGIFNVGTGACQSFNDVARAVIAWHGKGEIEYIPFPEHLKGRYQSYTQADISALRAAGYDKPFYTVEAGVKVYLDRIHQR